MFCQTFGSVHFHAWIARNYFDPHLQPLCLPFLSLKLTHNEAHGTQCWLNCANIWVPSRVSAAAAAGPSTSAPSVGEELRGPPAVQPAAETPTYSRDHSKEIVKENSTSRDTSEGTELNYIDREVMHLIL